jgi:hypothetical protein
VNVLGLGRMDNAKRRKRGGGNEDDSFHLVNQRGDEGREPDPWCERKKRQACCCVCGEIQLNSFTQ